MTHLKLSITSTAILHLLLCILSSVRASSNSPTKTTSQPKLYPDGRDRPHNYEIKSDKIVYSGWRRVIRRTVTSQHHPHHFDEYNSTKHQIDFDIIDQNHGTSGAVIIFAWNSTSKTATIVREYMPGCHRVLGGLAAGLVEVEKHSTADHSIADTDCEDRDLVAARCELEEEW